MDYHTMEMAPADLATKLKPGDRVRRRTNWMMQQLRDALRSRGLDGVEVGGDWLYVVRPDQRDLVETLQATVEANSPVAHDVVIDLDLGRGGRRMHADVERSLARQRLAKRCVEIAQSADTAPKRLGTRQRDVLLAAYDLVWQVALAGQTSYRHLEDVPSRCYIAITHADLAAKLKAHEPAARATLSRALRALARAGLVDLTLHGSRIHAIHVTPRGQQLVYRIDPLRRPHRR